MSRSTPAPTQASGIRSSRTAASTRISQSLARTTAANSARSPTATTRLPLSLHDHGHLCTYVRKVAAITRFEPRADRSIQNLSLDRLTIDRTANYRDKNDGF